MPRARRRRSVIVGDECQKHVGDATHTEDLKRTRCRDKKGKPKATTKRSTTNEHWFRSIGKQRIRSSCFFNILFSFLILFQQLQSPISRLLDASAVSTALCFLLVHGRGEHKPTLTGPTMVCGASGSSSMETKLREPERYALITSSCTCRTAVKTTLFLVFTTKAISKIVPDSTRPSTATAFSDEHHLQLQRSQCRSRKRHTSCSCANLCINKTRPELRSRF